MGRPFEVFPQLAGWESNVERYNRFVDEQNTERMTYVPGSDEDEEKVKEEEAWNKTNLVCRTTLEAIDPGRELLQCTIECWQDFADTSGSARGAPRL